MTLAPSSLLVLALPWLVLLAKTSVLLAVTALVARALARASAASRHLAWTLGLAGALALPLASAFVPAWTFDIPVQAAAKSVVFDEEKSLALGLAGPMNRGVAETAWERGDSTVLPASTTVATALPAPSTALAWAGLIAFALCVAGSLVALLRFTGALLSAHALVNRATPSASQSALDELGRRLCVVRPVRLVESGEIDVPMTFGALRPSLVVPAGFASWSVASQREVLLHELAHVERNDWLVTCLARLALVPFWFHPLARLAMNRLRAEAELAADDLVLAQGTKASSYAAHLLDLVRSLNNPPRSSAMTVSMLGGPFDQRIRALLDDARPRGPVSSRVRIALVAGTAVAVLLCSAVDVTASPSKRSAWDHANAVVREAFNMTPSDGHGWYSRGMSLHEDGQHEQAIEAFKAAIAGNAKVEAATYNIACGYALLGRENEALEWLQKAVDAGFDVGNYLYRDSDLASLRSNPRFQAFRDEHGDSSEIEAQRKRYAELVATGSKEAEDWAESGNDLLSEGDYDKAIEAFRRATEIEPYRTNALYNLACAHARNGNNRDALDALARAVDSGYTDADHAEDDADLASLHGESRYAQALEDMRRLEPCKIKRFMNWADGNDMADAKADVVRYQSYIQDHPKSGYAWFQLGFQSLRSADPKTALSSFQRCRDLGYKPATSAYNIACSHARLGDKDAAFEWLAKAQAEDFDVADYADDDEDLDSLRSDPRFKYEAHHRSVHESLRDLHRYVAREIHAY